jgi:hypothetical protein
MENEKARQRRKALPGFKLPLQGSNLDSSDPESDVLPVTPRGSTRGTTLFRRNTHTTPVPSHAATPHVCRTVVQRIAGVALAAFAVAGCRASAFALGDSPVAARAAAADFTGGFARRFTNVERDARFTHARERMGRFALAPSQLIGDSLAWQPPADSRTRTLVVEGKALANGFRFAARADAPEPASLGDQRHRFDLQRLENNDWRWRTRVEHHIGRFPIDRIGPLIVQSLMASSRGTDAIRGDLANAFPRSSAAFGRLVRFDGASVTSLPDGSQRVALHSHLDATRLGTTMPAFARYVRKYLSPLDYRFVVSTIDGRPAFEVRAARDSIAVIARVRDGQLIPLDGAAISLGDSLAVRVIASTRFGLFTVGVKQLDGIMTVVRTPRLRAWDFRWNRPPEWRLPFGTTTLLHGSLRRPFEGDGMLVRLGLRTGDAGQTLSIRDVDLTVRESWIVRWIGRLGGTAFSDFVEQAEIEENRFLAEGLRAFGADLSALLDD